MMARPVSVLIVGGGPVGLALAVECGFRGIGCVLVEQGDGKLNVPRMSGVSGRGMEFCRRWGIADKVRSLWPAAHPMDFVYVTTMVGEEITRTKIASYQQRERNLDYSPEGSCTCPAIFFDPILAEKAQSMPGVEIRYRTRLESFAQDNDAVHARLINQETGETETLSVRYMVGCDGAGGVVRPALGIELEGLGTIATSVNVYFRSPEFATMHDKGWARFYRFLDDEGCWAELVAIDGRELWRLSTFHQPEPDLTGHSYMRKLGGRDFSYELLDVSVWERRDFVAREYRRGRVLLAGDSAHQCSPTGGVGMHIGICEAVNLAWKLEALFAGWGGPRLLDSYGLESRPVAKNYVDLSTKTFDDIAGPPGVEGFRERLAADPDYPRRLNLPDQLRAQFCYENSPICIGDGSPPPEGDALLAPSARPGTRAPHCWIGDDRSTLDLFAGGFVLLRLGAPGADVDGLTKTAAELGMPLEVVDLDNTEAAALYEQPLILVRPDGHIAWRGAEAPNDAASLIDHVRGA
jgi:2-polyprenyl-6-methoxyphenol hydroxylase-like FAD-dependent oxidoreductase